MKSYWIPIQSHWILLNRHFCISSSYRSWNIPISFAQELSSSMALRPADARERRVGPWKSRDEPLFSMELHCYFWFQRQELECHQSKYWISHVLTNRKVRFSPTKWFFDALFESQIHKKWCPNLGSLTSTLDRTLLWFTWAAGQIPRKNGDFMGIS